MNKGIPMTNSDAEKPILSYSGFWRQVWAGSLDIVVVMLSFTIGIIFVYALWGAFTPDNSDRPLQVLSEFGPLLSLIYYFFYRTLLIASNAKASYGMRALNIITTDLNQNKLSLPQAMLRELLSYVSLLVFCLGYLIIPFTEKKQGFHDLLTGSLVLRKDPRLYF
jgi:uncharacterized RDD family membrane protein YckC